jgi:hypothetical protein
MTPTAAARALATIPTRRARLDQRETAATVRLTSALGAQDRGRVPGYAVWRDVDGIHVQPMPTIPGDQLAAWPDLDQSYGG